MQENITPRAYFKFIFIALVLAFSVSAEPAQNVANLNKIIEDLQASDWHTRNAALARLFQLIPGTGFQMLPQYKESEELKDALINLLENEAQKKPLPGEGYADYQSWLVRAVAGFKDKRAVPLLTGKYYGFNSSAERFLVNVQDKRITERLLSSLNDSRYENYPGEKTLALRVFTRKIKLNNIEEEFKPIVKQSIINAVSNDFYSVRISAVGALSAYEDPEIISIIEKVANNDPNDRVRKEAQKVLQKIYK